MQSTSYTHFIEDWVKQFNSSEDEEQLSTLSQISIDFSTIENATKGNITILKEFFNTLCFHTHKSPQIVIKFLQNNFSSIIKDVCNCFDDEIRKTMFGILLKTSQIQSVDIRDAIRHYYERSYILSEYYPAVKDYSIPSVFIELSNDDASQMSKGMFSEAIKSKLNDGIKLVGGEAIFKLIRAPKDAFSALQKLKILPPEVNESTFMKVTNAEQVALLSKYSDRIKEDLAWYEKPTICIRKWISINEEIRCFGRKGKIHAVCSAPNMETKFTPDVILSIVSSPAFEAMLKAIPQKSYVLDVAIYPTKEFRLVEINPFGKATSSYRYSWVVDSDILIWPGDKIDVRIK